MKKIFIALFCLMLVFGLASCQAKDAIEKVKEVLEFDSNDHFKKEVTYNFDMSMIEEGAMTQLTFKTDGECVAKSITKDKTENFNYTYKYVNGYIELNLEEGHLEYLKYNGDILCFAVSGYFGGTRTALTFLLGIKEGSAVSQKEKKVLGYMFDLVVEKGDEINVFNGTDKSKGYYVTYYQNGTFEKDGSEHFVMNYLNSDQIKGFNSSEEGIVWVEVTVQNNVYKVPLYVCLSEK